ncbi:hypothetical protein JM946_15085 [Steroidobacter sp. S1-65]|uniref:Uracil-DNA glycosylase n=1 Tax=Steroidobacter gossypii TaxID=2805490 RepID=A0ABS1WYK4_9GAMM|nr:hypothetical protein [Steroidobacter gossypii]MBM0106056.1 hypothetical protein [Steroidobacter gossypii]
MNASSQAPADERPAQDETALLNDWLDTALEQSFPASDPLPAFRGDPTAPSNHATADTAQGV